MGALQQILSSYKTATSSPPAFDSVATDVGANHGGAVTFTGPTVAANSNRVLIVDVVTAGAAWPTTVSGITYDGGAMTLVTSVESPNGYSRTERWRLIAPATGAKSIVVTFTGPGISYAIAARSYYDVNQTTPLGTSATASANSGTNATVDVTSATGELVIDAVGVTEPATTATVGSGQTQRSNVVSSGGFTDQRCATAEEDGATSVTMNWTLGASAMWSIIGSPLKPV